MNIYVGNLPYTIDDSQLRDMFAQEGEVRSARVITDRETGNSRGFGFVEMASDEEAEAAIARLNGLPMGGRKLTVNEAKPREGGGGGGGGGGRRPSRPRY
ncbi:MAG: RNA-binding protein [Pseudomonadota bacterium]